MKKTQNKTFHWSFRIWGGGAHLNRLFRFFSERASPFSECHFSGFFFCAPRSESDGPLSSFAGRKSRVHETPRRGEQTTELNNLNFNSIRLRHGGTTLPPSSPTTPQLSGGTDNPSRPSLELCSADQLILTPNLCGGEGILLCFFFLFFFVGGGGFWGVLVSWCRIVLSYKLWSAVISGKRHQNCTGKVHQCCTIGCDAMSGCICLHENGWCGG